MNSYTEYCKVFTKALKTAINKHKGPCSAKEFDNMISGFVTELYGIKPVVEHPFATEQDAYNFAYCTIFTITSTTTITIDDFKRVTGEIGTRLPEQFLQDMYTHIMERKNVIKKFADQVVASTTKMISIARDYEVIKSEKAECVEKGEVVATTVDNTVCTGIESSAQCNATASTSFLGPPGVGLKLNVGGTTVESGKKADDANSYCSVM